MKLNTKQQKQQTSVHCGPNTLPRWELLLYWLLWILSVTYALYRVYTAGRDHLYELSASDFSRGWHWIGRLKDSSDYEWEVWSKVLWDLLPWLFLHSLTSQVIRSWYPSMLPHVLFTFSFVYLYFIVGIWRLIYLLIHIFLMYLGSRTHSVTAVWTCNIAFLFAPNFAPTAAVVAWFVGDDAQMSYLMSVMVAWNSSRCLSYGVEQCRSQCKSSFWDGFILLLAYSCYLPLLLLGPLIPYHEFEEDLQQPSKEWTADRFMKSIFQFLRFTFWMFFADYILHWMYFNALQFDTSLLERLDLWEVCGIGYALGQFFMLKYVVFFGLPCVFAHIEQIRTPGTPKCIGRIHLYSDMWKYFDRGLYGFLSRYIYIPLLGHSRHPGRKIMASAVCFAFVFLWHGVHDYVFIWALLNFLGIILERLGHYIANNHFYIFWENKLFPSHSGKHRWRAMVIAPLLLMSALSNFYFFSLKDGGDTFVRIILFKSSVHGRLLVLFFLYCMSHVGSHMKEVERDWQQIDKDRSNNVEKTRELKFKNRE